MSISEEFGFSVPTWYQAGWCGRKSRVSQFPVLRFVGCGASYLMRFHGNHPSPPCLSFSACKMGSLLRLERGCRRLDGERGKSGGDSIYWCAACMTFTFNSATGHAPWQSPGESACKAFYHLDPVRSGLSPGKILITHWAFNSSERQKRQYSAAGYFFLSLSPSHRVSVKKKKNKWQRTGH